MTGDEFICWDTSVFISWVKGESEELDLKIKSIMQHVTNGKRRLLVSSLLYAEILPSKMSSQAMETFEQAMKNRETVQVLNVDLSVARKAQKIRNDTGMKTPDAVHVATALVGEANLFHTFDKGLLSLDRRDEVEGLAITACEVPGTTLPLL